MIFFMLTAPWVVKTTPTTMIRRPYQAFQGIVEICLMVMKRIPGNLLHTAVQKFYLQAITLTKDDPVHYWRPNNIIAMPNIPHIWGLVCRKQVSRPWTCNYLPQYLWELINCPRPWYLLLAHKSSYQSFVCLFSLRWRHNDHAGVSNHQPNGCLLNHLFRRKSKKTSKLRVTGLCAGNSPGTGEFPAQMASYAENFSIWWRHHGNGICYPMLIKF